MNSPNYCPKCDYPLREIGRDWLGNPILTCEGDLCGWRSDGADESVRHLGDTVQAVLLDGDPQ